MSASRRRVVVTGMGVVSSVGLTVKSMWESLLAGKSGIAPITLYDAGQHSVKIAGECHGFLPENYIEKREARRLDRFSQLAVAASNEAVSDSKLDFTKEDTTRCGVIMGAGIGGITE